MVLIGEPFCSHCCQVELVGQVQQRLCVLLCQRVIDLSLGLVGVLHAPHSPGAHVRARVLKSVCICCVLQVARLQWTALAYRPKMMAKYAVK